MARRYVLRILNLSKELRNSNECELTIQEIKMPSISLSLHWFKKGAPPGLDGRD